MLSSHATVFDVFSVIEDNVCHIIIDYTRIDQYYALSLDNHTLSSSRQPAQFVEIEIQTSSFLVSKIPRLE